MARVKPKRHGVVMDMTAMCDVAWLLLTFFILTTHFKKPDVESITTPASISEKKLDDKNVMTILITPDGRYYFTPTDNSSERDQLLDKMAGKYQVGFTAKEKAAFLKTHGFGAPMSQLPQYLLLTDDQQGERKSSIPMDSLHKELIDWVKYSLEVNPQAQLAIKGDQKAMYPKFKQLFEGLRDIDFYKFVLITNQK